MTRRIIVSLLKNARISVEMITCLAKRRSRRPVTDIETKKGGSSRLPPFFGRRSSAETGLHHSEGRARFVRAHGSGRMLPSLLVELHRGVNRCEVGCFVRSSRGPRSRDSFPGELTPSLASLITSFDPNYGRVKLKARSPRLRMTSSFSAFSTLPSVIVSSPFLTLKLPSLTAN